MVTAQRLTLKSAIMERYYNIIRCWIVLIPTLLLVASCQEGHEAGDLFGMWRLTESKHISFSGSVASFRHINDFRAREVFANFQHQGDSLFIQCSSIKKDQLDTVMVENEFGMKPFTNIRVKIDAVDGDRLLLSKDGQRWSFEKW